MQEQGFNFAEKGKLQTRFLYRRMLVLMGKSR